MPSPDDRLRELGIELPDPLSPVATYRMAKRHGDMLYLSGHVCFALDGSGVIAGKVGDDLSDDEATRPHASRRSTCWPRCAASSVRSTRWPPS